MDAADNLRGWDVLVEFDGIQRLVTVITHLRGPLWLVEGRALPKRFERFGRIRRTTVMRHWMTLVAAPVPRVRKTKAR